MLSWGDCALRAESAKRRQWRGQLTKDRRTREIPIEQVGFLPSRAQNRPWHLAGGSASLESQSVCGGGVCPVPPRLRNLPAGSACCGLACPHGGIGRRPRGSDAAASDVWRCPTGDCDSPEIDGRMATSIRTAGAVHRSALSALGVRARRPSRRSGEFLSPGGIADRAARTPIPRFPRRSEMARRRSGSG